MWIFDVRILCSFDSFFVGILFVLNEVFKFFCFNFFVCESVIKLKIVLNIVEFSVWLNVFVNVLRVIVIFFC